ncbi:GNAT family N-acetyltransferase/peptidase C39 family protein [Breoghania sp. L-A4]|uniref:GNAT family N-acetyltransferase/peptidase C39 family protein n=1 Tax=Breoghania sp. L-A4 TaxID=2304600 RepID=UPI000E35A89F|nr:GNAT family N-acetyltransferase/peptidase C39 family protein [Breoghania sp. L-A4]AXS42642.1 GNAT family N-acetyltransferase [Breoghania sp. L-A4]
MSPPLPIIRHATAEDLDALVALEQRCFESDRISRRSFRRFLKVESAVVLIAATESGVAGSAVMLFRSGTALARLYSLAVDPAAQGRGLGAALLEACETAAIEHDRLILRLEVRADNAAACGLYRSRGYRACGQVPDYYEDGMTALRFEKLLHDTGFANAAAPYYQQSTEFTCGPACLAMALKHFESGVELTQRLELRLWREATTIYLASGHGGCGPYGLAVAAVRRGLAAEIRINTTDFLFLASVRDPEKQRVMRIAQQDYRDEAARLGIKDRREILGPRELAEQVAGGAVALVLISGYQMFRRKEPHWVLVHSSDARHLVIHDPWLEYEGFESATDSSNLPIPDAAFDRMARWGRAGVRAQVLLRRAG